MPELMICFISTFFLTLPIPGLGRSPGEENRNPLQYSCLEKPMDREAWPAMVHGISELDMIETT